MFFVVIAVVWLEVEWHFFFSLLQGGLVTVCQNYEFIRLIVTRFVCFLRFTRPKTRT